MSDIDERWVLVVDTDSYAGNFQRAIGEYVVGYSNEYSQGNYLRLFEQEMKMEEDDESPFANLWDIEDTEYGPEVATLWATPGFFNDGHGNHHPIIHLDTKPEKIIATYVKTVEDYAKKHNTKHFDADLEDVRKNGIKAIHQHPAYQSVGIRLASRPDPHTLKQLVERIRKFAEIYGSDPDSYEKKIKLLGIRLEHAKTTWNTEISFPVKSVHETAMPK